jgi:hypothetical protein
VRTDAIHSQQSQREQHPVPQIWNAEEVSERFKETIHFLTWPCSLNLKFLRYNHSLRYNLERAAGLGDLFLG